MIELIEQSDSLIWARYLERQYRKRSMNWYKIRTWFREVTNRAWFMSIFLLFIVILLINNYFGSAE